MSVNIIQQLEKSMNIDPLIKMDPNTQDVPESTVLTTSQKIFQAIIPAVMAGLYKAGKSEEGIQILANDPLAQDWAFKLFGENKTRLLENIARYASLSMDETESKFNSIANNAVSQIREAVKDKDTTELKSLMASQRDNILVYLPATLELGDILQDETLDDRTNKMEGPISSLLRKIQTGFSGNETAEDIADKAENK